MLCQQKSGNPGKIGLAKAGTEVSISFFETFAPKNEKN
jgi:hypothetical protein